MQLELFKNNEFGAVRALVDKKGEVWFALVDVCNALGIKNPRDAKTRLKEDGVGITDGVDKLGRKAKVTIINESNLYRLIFQSRKEEAIRFQDWVVEEVIPTIRKHGIYATDDVIEKTLKDPDFMIKLLTELKKEREEKKKLENKLKEATPYIETAKAMELSEGSLKIGDWVKGISREHNVVIGRNKAFEWLRDNGYLSRDNKPYQKYIDAGYFEPYNRLVKMGSNSAYQTTTYITGKGQVKLTPKIIAYFKGETK